MASEEWAAPNISEVDYTTKRDSLCKFVVKYFGMKTKTFLPKEMENNVS